MPYNATTYVVKWDNRSYDADCFIQFTFDENGNAISATLKPIAPITDFSYDFEDLKLTKTD